MTKNSNFPEEFRLCLIIDHRSKIKGKNRKRKKKKKKTKTKHVNSMNLSLAFQCLYSTASSTTK